MELNQKNENTNEQNFEQELPETLLRQVENFIWLKRENFLLNNEEKLTNDLDRIQRFTQLTQKVRDYSDQIKQRMRYLMNNKEKFQDNFSLTLREQDRESQNLKIKNNSCERKWETLSNENIYQEKMNEKLQDYLQKQNEDLLRNQLEIGKFLDKIKTQYQQLQIAAKSEEESRQQNILQFSSNLICEAFAGISKQYEDLFEEAEIFLKKLQEKEGEIYQQKSKFQSGKQQFMQYLFENNESKEYYEQIQVLKDLLKEFQIISNNPLFQNNHNFKNIENEIVKNQAQIEKMEEKLDTVQYNEENEKIKKQIFEKMSQLNQKNNIYDLMNNSEARYLSKQFSNLDELNKEQNKFIKTRMYHNGQQLIYEA